MPQRLYKALFSAVQGQEGSPAHPSPATPIAIPPHFLHASWHHPHPITPTQNTLRCPLGRGNGEVGICHEPRSCGAHGCAQPPLSSSTTAEEQHTGLGELELGSRHRQARGPSQRAGGARPATRSACAGPRAGLSLHLPPGTCSVPAAPAREHSPFSSFSSFGRLQALHAEAFPFSTLHFDSYHNVQFCTHVCTCTHSFVLLVHRLSLPNCHP